MCLLKSVSKTTILGVFPHKNVCMCASLRACVCVCVRERERERERLPSYGEAKFSSKKKT